ncbi:hypothetical protein ACFVWN_27610 [Nocardiopsis flavescens]|uniref:Excreted virulence factor EspC, type VII ESX diderm n=1 Tax=Nocardiopsis flavescens TaxID=758803 RepID=A0A1M6N9U0_9ACTN|nr:hypothetical protein [Nocardiopsis flavescens]SHJ92462.1 hypothetical protein SAMN05421803_111126 [Nocardiopsis flavescens]
MSSEEVGANTWAAAEKAVQAEAMAEAMVGLEETFTMLMDDLAGYTGWISSGYVAVRDDLQPEVHKVQQNGISLANGIQAGASEIALNDYEAGDRFSEAWAEMPDVNFRPDRPEGAELF